MAKILADKDIRKLFGTVILNADEKRLNPNGLEIRLGKYVLFQSTSEEKELAPGTFLRVRPGESVLISSYEDFTFTKEAIQKVFPGCDLMAFITPTTTMMREGIMQTATKVDSGWKGTLNWGLRNSSIKDFVLGFSEPIFKLTIFLLEDHEVPEIPYGERESDLYQGTQGIARSTRQIPADIPKNKLVSSSVEQLDPARQLREAGYPFDHISTELTTLHGKFEVVSKDVLFLKDEFEQRTGELRTKIEEEAKNLSIKVDESRKTALEMVEALFDRKFLSVFGAVVACGSIMYGAVLFLQSQGLTARSLGAVVVAGGIGIWWITSFLARRKPQIPEKLQ